MKRKFRAPALKSSSCALKRSRIDLLGSGLKLSRRKSMQNSLKKKTNKSKNYAQSLMPTQVTILEKKIVIIGGESSNIENE